MLFQSPGLSFPVKSGGLGGWAVLIGLVLWVGPVHGQQAPTAPAQFVRTQWTAVEKGLSSNGVRDIVQTDGGYLWLGTEGGLARFDGSAFEETRLTRLEAETRTGDRILDIAEYGEGLLVLYRSRDLLHYRSSGVTSVADSVWAFQVGDDGRVWVGAGRDVAVYRDGTIEWGAPRPVGSAIRALHRTDTGTLWVGTEDEGLYRRTPGGDVMHLTTNDGLLANGIHTFAEDKGALLIGTTAGLQRWEKGQLTELAPPDTAGTPFTVVQVRGDVQGTCWAQTTQGVYRCDGNRLVPYLGRTSAFQPRPKYMSPDFVQEGPEGHLYVNRGRTLYRDGIPVFETEFAIRSVTHDAEGTLWIGTDTRGLFQLRPSTVTVYGRDEGLPENSVTTIARRQDGSIWMGTRSGGLVHFRDGIPTTYRLQKGGRPLRPLFTLHEDRSGQLWVGGTRLCRFENGQCAQPDGTGPISRTLITSIHEDRQGRLWVGTLGRGLYRRNPETEEWTQLTPENSPLTSPEVRWLHESPTGDLWIATVAGRGSELLRYRNGRFEVFPDSLLPGRHPSYIHQDTRGVLWLGTTEYGINRIDLRRTDSLSEATVTEFRKRDGLYQNTVYQVIGDEQGRLWVNSPNGLFWVRRSALEAVARGEREDVRSVVYTTRDGLRNVEGNGFGVPGAVQAEGGRLWFPNQGGAVVLDPSTIPVETPPPRMHVEAVTSGDSLVTDAPELAVALEEEQRTFSVEYTGIRTSDSEGVTFRYRLAGLQDDWVEVGSRREAFFTEVPPGEYTFEVVGRTRNGPWSTEPARLTLTVAPFFYETWWFYSLCGLTLGLMGLGLVRYWFYALRRRQEELRQEVEDRTEALADAKEQAEDALETVEEQAEQLRQLDEMKSRFFANVSHELRTPLSLMIGPIQQMLETNDRNEEENEVLEIVHRNAERLERLVEQLLHLARYDAGHLHLNLQQQAWGSFVEQVVQRFTPMAETQGVALSVSTEGAESAVPFDPDHMETVIANLVRNALTYTPSGSTVTVKATVKKDTAGLLVVDDGPGIPEEEQDVLFDRFYRGAGQAERGGMGIGLALTQALVALHEGTIGVKSAAGEGSRFTVQWPVSLSFGGDAHAHESQPVVDESEPLTPVGGDGQERSGGETGPMSTPDEDEPPQLLDRTTVLVVEDNADVRRYVRSLLEPRYRVIEAANGAKGLKMTRADLPDLVVADVMMPELDGIAMLTHLSQSDRTAHIPVVMLTARAEAEDRVEGLEEGADAYVTKPFDAGVLAAQVDGLIATRLQLRERYEGAEGEEAEADTDDDSFEGRVRSAVQAHLTDSDFIVQDLADEVGRTRRTVTRRVKEAFGMSPSALIRTMRLEQGAGTISEVAYAVGFNSLSYFSRRFKEHFGVSPSEYRRTKS